MSSDRPPLLVLIHGIYGSSLDYSLLSSVIRARMAQLGADSVRNAGSVTTYLRAAAPLLSVLVARSNESRTTEGVETLGQLLADEVTRAAEGLPCPHALYFVGHSLGGLVARSAAAELTSSGVLGPDAGATLTPLGYLSICSPHLGVRKPGGTLAKSTWRALIHALLSAQYGPTGKQLGLMDGNDTHPPLLQRMADPDSRFMRALASFRLRTLLSTWSGDLSVPYATSVAQVCRPPWLLEEGAAATATPRRTAGGGGNPFAPAPVSPSPSPREVVYVPWRRQDRHWVVLHAEGFGGDGEEGVAGAGAGSGARLEAGATAGAAAGATADGGAGAGLGGGGANSMGSRDAESATLPVPVAAVTVAGAVAPVSFGGSEGMRVDWRRELECPAAIVHGLNSLAWRRLVIHVPAVTHVGKVFVHTFTIGKHQLFDQGQHEFSSALCELLLRDAGLVST